MCSGRHALNQHLCFCETWKKYCKIDFLVIIHVSVILSFFKPSFSGSINLIFLWRNYNFSVIKSSLVNQVVRQCYDYSQGKRMHHIYQIFISFTAIKIKMSSNNSKLTDFYQKTKEASFKREKSSTDTGTEQDSNPGNGSCPPTSKKTKP